MEEKLYEVTSGSSYEVVIKLTKAEIESVACSGENGPAVNELFANPRVRNMLDEQHDNVIKVFDEVFFKYKNEDWPWEIKARYVLWDACWNALDEGVIDDEEEEDEEDEEDEDEEEYSGSWAVKFEIVLDDGEYSFDELDECTQKHILDAIGEGYYSGELCDVRLE